MPEQSLESYRKLFSELIKKQVVVLGPDITLAKVKSIPGIEVDGEGNVTKIEGDPQALLQSLINQFVELSGLIVKKTMESILASYTVSAGIQAAEVINHVAAAQNGQNPYSGQANNPTPPQPASPVSPTPASSNGSMEGFSQAQLTQLNQMIQEINSNPQESPVQPTNTTRA